MLKKHCFFLERRRRCCCRGCCRRFPWCLFCPRFCRWFWIQCNDQVRQRGIQGFAMRVVVTPRVGVIDVVILVSIHSVLIVVALRIQYVTMFIFINVGKCFIA